MVAIAIVSFLFATCPELQANVRDVVIFLGVAFHSGCSKQGP